MARLTQQPDVIRVSDVRSRQRKEESGPVAETPGEEVDSVIIGDGSGEVSVEALAALVCKFGKH